MAFSFSFETAATPAQVFDAFTDFSPRRLETWQGTLDPRTYELMGWGEDWAVVREGAGGRLGIWVVVRYEWSGQDTVRWELVDSNHCDRGSGLISIRPAAGGGSRVETRLDHEGPRGLRGHAVLGLERLLGPYFFPRLWKRALDRRAAPG